MDNFPSLEPHNRNRSTKTVSTCSGAMMPRPMFDDSENSTSVSTDRLSVSECRSETDGSARRVISRRRTQQPRSQPPSCQHHLEGRIEVDERGLEPRSGGEILGSGRSSLLSGLCTNADPVLGLPQSWAFGLNCSISLPRLHVAGAWLGGYSAKVWMKGCT